MMLTYAVFPYEGEFAVAHMGSAKPCGQEKFQTCWIVDCICSTEALAIEAQAALDKLQRQRLKTVNADIKSLERRRFGR